MALFWYNRHTSTSVRVQQLKSELEAGLDLWRKQVDYQKNGFYGDLTNEDENFDNDASGDDDIDYLTDVLLRK